MAEVRGGRRSVARKVQFQDPEDYSAGFGSLRNPVVAVSQAMIMQFGVCPFKSSLQW